METRKLIGLHKRQGMKTGRRSIWMLLAVVICLSLTACSRTGTKVALEGAWKVLEASYTDTDGNVTYVDGLTFYDTWELPLADAVFEFEDETCTITGTGYDTVEYEYKIEDSNLYLYDDGESVTTFACEFQETEIILKKVTMQTVSSNGTNSTDLYEITLTKASDAEDIADEEWATEEPEKMTAQESVPEEQLTSGKLGGTYVARISRPSNDGVSDLVCEVTDGTDSSFTLKLTIYSGNTIYELEPVSCQINSDGTFVSDYAEPADGYPYYNWESSRAEYFRIEGEVASDKASITITGANEYTKAYDGTMEKEYFTAMDLDGSRSWLGFFHNTSGYGGLDDSYYTHTAERIPGSEEIENCEYVLDAVGAGLYASVIGNDYYQCNISNITSDSFDMDLGVLVNGTPFSLDTVTCYYDPDETMLSRQYDWMPFYSELTYIASENITSDNSDYWGSRGYALMGYLDPNGAVIYVTVIEYLEQGDGSYVENEDVDRQSWVQYFISDAGGHKPQRAFRMNVS